MKKRFAVILSGCGFKDGAEIHESTMTMLAINQTGNTYQCFAPDIAQRSVVNHLTGKEVAEKRNVLVESARIARGNIKPMTSFRAEDFDAIILPGGFGAALNLSTFAVDGIDCEVNPDVQRALKAMHQAGKPIGALCISPVILAKVFGKVTLTVGQDAQVSGMIRRMGADPRPTNHEEVIIDPHHKLATGPCYMLNADIGQIARGAMNVVEKVLMMI